MPSASKLIIFREGQKTQALPSIARLADYLQSRGLPAAADVVGYLAGGFPLKVCPSDARWSDESGITHQGFVVRGLKLPELEYLRQWDQETGPATVLSVGDASPPEIALALGSVGLKINPLA